MPRQARISSSTGIYHIMIRGINRQLIFEDSEDEETFLALLHRYKKRCGFLLFGYCLMHNHVHLLLKEAANPSIDTINNRDVIVGPGEPLEKIFKRLGVSYAYFFNRKYQRTGHLFQDRYRCEAVENEAYLLRVLRYIHLNPVKAGLCAAPDDYSRSSYKDYLYGSNDTLTDTQFILDILPKKALEEFTNQSNEDQFLDDDSKANNMKTDREAIGFLCRITGRGSASDFQQLNRHDRDSCLQMLFAAGFSIKQISRITGCSRTIVYKALGK